MSEVLACWNELPVEAAVLEIISCCGSTAWASQLVARRPFQDVSSLVAASDEIWTQLEVEDWLDAFTKHPRIGERKVPHATTQAAAWSAEEQQSVSAASAATRSALAQANREYELRFGRVFLVCATGKSAAEMLDILRKRLQNDDATELRAAAEEQRKITNIRLKKWLEQ